MGPTAASASVVYLGMVHPLPGGAGMTGGLDGGELAVVEQNLRSTSMEALAAQGRPVRLIWERQYVSPIGGHGALTDGAPIARTCGHGARNVACARG